MFCRRYVASKYVVYIGLTAKLEVEIKKIGNQWYLTGACQAASPESGDFKAFGRYKVVESMI